MKTYGKQVDVSVYISKEKIYFKMIEIGTALPQLSQSLAHLWPSLILAWHSYSPDKRELGSALPQLSQSLAQLWPSLALAWHSYSQLSLSLVQLCTA